MKDIQNLKDTRNVDIQKVGIKHVDVPLIIQRKNNSNQVVSAKARVNVSLPRDYKGTHMSRFVEVLNEWQLKYFLEKKSPVTELPAQMAYDCSFEGRIDDDNYKFILGVQVPVTTLCPCSKEISENGAHNQRAFITVKVSYDEDKHIWIEDLITLVESCASCPVYPLLKREDEKFVTEKAWDNPKFVEDVLRDVVVKLREHKTVKEFEVECEAFESIHNHSAWAYQKEVK